MIHVMHSSPRRRAVASLVLVSQRTQTAVTYQLRTDEYGRKGSGVGI